VNENSYDDSDSNQYNFSIKNLLQEVVHGAEQRSVISEQKVISVYKSKVGFLRERSKHGMNLCCKKCFRMFISKPEYLSLNLQVLVLVSAAVPLSPWVSDDTSSCDGL
jgi:hypothetical protein